MAADELERSIDALYQTPLDQFTAKRNELAASLKKAGDRDNADRVKALTKPGVAAWAVNQAWWRDQDAVRALLDAGADLRRAHLAFANGKATDIRAAVEARQQAVDAVIDRALDALGGPGKVAADLRHRIAVTVEALASSGWPDGLSQGRLTADLQASGFEALSALAGIPSSSPPPPPKAPAKPTLVPRPADAPGVSKKEAREAAKAELAARDREQQIERARARLEESEGQLREAATDVKETAAAEKKAQQELKAANDEAAALEEQLEQARERQREARREASQASQAASQAEMSRARAAREVEKAREQVDEAKRS